MTRRADTIAAMSYTFMGRRVIVWSTVIGVVFAVIGLVLRPTNIDFAVGAFLLALGAFSLAGYGVLERLADRLPKRSKR
jgi:drug/metabolite transporter (DMT)-like permease